MTRVLLTGGTGFVGSPIRSSLNASGGDVLAVVRSGKVPPTKNLSAVIETPDMFAEGYDFWAKACAEVDLVLHVAWYAEPGKYLQSPLNLHCLAGTLLLAMAARDAGARFVGIGTCLEYALTGRPLDTEAPLGPTTAYSAAKAAAFIALSNSLEDFAWCRLFYLYGKGEDPRRLVPYLHARLSAGEPADLTSGTQVRDYMDVSTAADQIAAIALSRRQGAQNICSGIPTTVAALATEIAQSYGREDLLRFGARAENSDDPAHVVGVPSITEEAIQ
jgi:nucleoside-diphosphate-sugar epimerase